MLYQQHSGILETLMQKIRVIPRELFHAIFMKAEPL